MSNRIFSAIGLLLGLVLLSPTSYGAATGGANYEVEIVVFKNLMPDLEGKEIWSPDRVDASLPDMEKTARAADAKDEKSVLGKAVAAMKEQEKYVVMAHKRWTQGAEAKSTSPVMRISTEEGELDGTFTFYMSRFLHVQLQLLLKEQAEATDQAAPPATTAANAPSNSAEPVATPVLAYRIEESRRIRSNQVHYFDHPKFGALVRISPLEDKSRN